MLSTVPGTWETQRVLTERQGERAGEGERREEAWRSSMQAGFWKAEEPLDSTDLFACSQPLLVSIGVPLLS